MEKEFLEKLKARDEKTIIEFIERYRTRIYLTAYKLSGNVEDSLDICQDVFIKVLENIGRLNDPQYADAYINRIAINCSYDYLRARYKPDRFHDILMLFSKRQRSPAESLNREELRGKILKAVNKLAPGERKIIILYYFHDLKIREICDALDISEGAVKKQMSRAKLKLEQMLRKELR